MKLSLYFCKMQNVNSSDYYNEIELSIVHFVEVKNRFENICFLNNVSIKIFQTYYYFLSLIICKNRFVLSSVLNYWSSVLTKFIIFRFPCATTTVYRSILLIKDVLQVLRLQHLRSSGRFQVLP